MKMTLRFTFPLDKMQSWIVLIRQVAILKVSHSQCLDINPDQTYIILFGKANLRCSYLDNIAI